VTYVKMRAKKLFKDIVANTPYCKETMCQLRCNTPYYEITAIHIRNFCKRYVYIPEYPIGSMFTVSLNPYISYIRYGKSLRIFSTPRCGT